MQTKLRWVLQTRRKIACSHAYHISHLLQFQNTQTIFFSYKQGKILFNGFAALIDEAHVKKRAFHQRSTVKKWNKSMVLILLLHCKILLRSTWRWLGESESKGRVHLAHKKAIWINALKIALYKLQFHSFLVEINSATKVTFPDITKLGARRVL
jgi:hypothetical protein